MAQRDFQRLVKLVARLFYAEGVPPAEETLPDDDDGPRPRKKPPPVSAARAFIPSLMCAPTVHGYAGTPN